MALADLLPGAVKRRDHLGGRDVGQRCPSDAAHAEARCSPQAVHSVISSSIVRVAHFQRRGKVINRMRAQLGQVIVDHRECAE